MHPRAGLARAALLGVLMSISVAATYGPPRMAGTMVTVGPALNGLVYDVQLTLSPPTAGPALSTAFPCPVQPDAGQNYQFVFDVQGSTLSLTVNDGASVALSPSGDGFAFAALPLALPGAQLIANGRVRLGDLDASGVPHTLVAPEFHAQGTAVTGDIAATCDWMASGSGGLDTAPPAVAFPLDCSDAATGKAAPCLLLNDATIGVQFSEPVRAAALQSLIVASDAGGTPIPLSVTPAAQPFTSGVAVSGFWPLGETVTLLVSPGVQDRAGNATEQAFSEQLRVVDDPGDLDAAANSGFEAGTRTGYTVNILREYLQTPKGGMDSALYLAESRAGLSDQSVMQMSPSLFGILPTEGQLMAVLGEPTGCRLGEVALTARFLVPEGASALAFDYNLVGPARGLSDSTRPLVSVTLQSPSAAQTASTGRPQPSAMTALDGANAQSGWQTLAVPVDGLIGREVVMTLHARGSSVIGPPPDCTAGRVLLDNLRFQ